MNDDHLEEEVFEGRVEISALENGQSFSLGEQSYFRLANFAMTASGVGIQPALICRLSNAQRGCRLVLFGNTHQFDVVVRSTRSGVMIDYQRPAPRRAAALRRSSLLGGLGLRRPLVARVAPHVRARADRVLRQPLGG
jgi:hypothetical protein